MNRSRVILAAIVVVTLLGGCAPTDADPTPPPVAETPAETPAPEPTKPALDELVLSANGLGPLVIGEAPPVTGPELDVAIFDDDFCADDVANGFITDPGKWVANYPTSGTEYPEFPFSILVEDGVLTNLYETSPLIHTAGGVGVGSTVAELRAAHPDAVRISKDYIDLYVIAGENGQLVFEVGTEGSIGYDPGVIWIAHVIPADETPYAYANSDAGFGGCTRA
ncbi:MAG: hypothetical protein ACOH1T_00220 [Microbacteriaceae bacterium]